MTFISEISGTDSKERESEKVHQATRRVGGGHPAITPSDPESREEI